MENILLSCHHIDLNLNEVPILEDINLSLNAGEFHLLIGENGTGKTSIVNILSGVYPAGSFTGSISYFGKNVRFHNPRDAWKKKIITLHQDICLFDNLTIAENLFANLPKAFSSKGLMSVDKKIRMANEFFVQHGLSIDSSRLVSQCSPVTKRTVELAKLFLLDPQILILDEPLAVSSRSELEFFLSQMNYFKEKGVAILCIAHEFQSFLSVIDRFTILRDKKLVATMDRKEYLCANKETLLLGDFCQSRYPKINTKPGAEVLCLENVSTENTLDNISLTLHKGEILGIFGQAGSGKSSLSKILFGIEPAKSGTIYIDRLPAKIASPQDAINLGLAYITDERSEYGLFENLDSLENVYAVKENRCGHFWSRTRFEFRQFYRYAHRLNIPARPGAIPCHLSGGEQQKLILMRWFMSQAKIFIFNEPTQSIDIPSRIDIYNLFNDLILKGRSILLFSSNLEELIGMCDRIIVINHGIVSGEISYEEGMKSLHKFL